MSEVEKLRKELKKVKSDLKTCQDAFDTASNQLIASRRDRNTDVKNLTQKLSDCENKRNQLQKELEDYKKRCADLEIEIVSQKS